MKRSLTLLMAAAGAALTLGLSGCAGTPGGASGEGSGPVDDSCDTTTTLKYQVYPGSTVNLWPDVAAKEGFFSKYCIDAVPVVVNSGPAALAQLASGDLQTMMSTPDNFVQARANDFKLKIVATAAQRASLGFVISTKTLESAGDDPIASLKGATIGINAQGTQMQYFAAALLKEHGVEASEVKFVGLGTPTAMIASLTKGDIAAAVLDAPFSDAVVSSGLAEKFSDMRYPLGPDNTTPMPEVFAPMEGLASSYAFSEDFIAENPDAVKAWVSAIADATTFAADPANRDAVRAVEQEVARVVIPDGTPDAESVFNTAVDAAAAASNPGAKTDADKLQAWIDWTSAVRGIPNPPSLDDLLWQG